MRSSGLFWLKHVAMVDILFVIYGSSVFSSVYAITERIEMCLYDVLMSMFLLGFGIGNDVC